MAKPLWGRRSFQDYPWGKFNLQKLSYWYLILRFDASQGDQLLVADPKALQRIFNTGAYRYPKQPNLRVISLMLNGKGVIWADGIECRVFHLSRL